MNELIIDRVNKILSHIEGVRNNCEKLGKKLIDLGSVQLGLRLIANGLIHDNSKFSATEWDNLDHFTGVKEDGDRVKLDLAISQRNRTNPHHPECWPGGIVYMPDVYLAEMVCDWASRSAEFGTSLHDWIDGGAMERFGYKKNDKTYKKINYFVGLLLDKPFRQKKCKPE